jgi:hypothetical protein
MIYRGIRRASLPARGINSMVLVLLVSVVPFLFSFHLLTLTLSGIQGRRWFGETNGTVLRL